MESESLGLISYGDSKIFYVPPLRQDEKHLSLKTKLVDIWITGWNKACGFVFLEGGVRGREHFSPSLLS